MVEKSGILNMLSGLGRRRHPSKATPPTTELPIGLPQTLTEESSERLFGEPTINTVYQGVAVSGKQGIREALRAYAVLYYKTATFALDGVFPTDSIVKDATLTPLQILNHEKGGRTLDFIERYVREVDHLEIKSRGKLSKLRLVSGYDQRSTLELHFRDHTTDNIVQDRQGLGSVAAPFLLHAFELRRKELKGRGWLSGLFGYNYQLELPSVRFGVDTSSEVCGLLRNQNIAVERPVGEVDVDMPIACNGDIFTLDTQDITSRLSTQPHLFDPVDPVTLAESLSQYGEYTLKKGQNYDIRVRVTNSESRSHTGSKVTGKKATYLVEKQPPILQISIIPTNTEYPNYGTLDPKSIIRANELATRISEVFK